MKRFHVEVVGKCFYETDVDAETEEEAEEIACEKAYNKGDIIWETHCKQNGIYIETDKLPF